MTSGVNEIIDNIQHNIYSPGVTDTTSEISELMHELRNILDELNDIESISMRIDNVYPVKRCVNGTIGLLESVQRYLGSFESEVSEIIYSIRNI